MTATTWRGCSAGCSAPSRPEPALADDLRRGVIVRLTREGKAAVDGAFTALIEAERSLLAELPAGEQKQLASLLRRLLLPFTEPPPSG